MKIRSITDVITNSSTEVFAMTSRKTVEDLKEMINMILELSGSSKTADDFFIFELSVNWWEEDWMKESIEGWTEMTEDQKVDACIELADQSYDYYYLYPQVNIIPKSDKIPKKLIRLLEDSSWTGINSVDATYG